MKKRLLSFLLAALMTVLVAFPAFAADGLNADEQGLYNYFAAQVNSKSWLGKELNAEYLAMAEGALMKVDLDKAACDDLQAAIDGVMAIINTNGVDSLHKSKQFHDQYLNVVNPVAGKYNMKVELDAKTGVATVYVNGVPVVITKPAVNQTGFSSVAAAAVSAVLVILAVGAFMIIRKRRLFA